MAIAALALALGACEENADVRDSAAADGGGGLSIEPSIGQVGRLGSTAFVVSGGLPPYRWTVANSAYGAVAASDDEGRAVTYTATALAGSNVIEVRDSHNPPWNALVSVIQD